MDLTDERMELLDLYMQVAKRFGQVMHEVHMRCDPSNATGLVDQLERRDLVHRTTPPDDRRKRVVEATDEGRAVQKVLRQAMAATQSRFDRLTGADTAELRRILRVLADDDEPEGPP